MCKVFAENTGSVLRSQPVSAARISDDSRQGCNFIANELEFDGYREVSLKTLSLYQMDMLMDRGLGLVSV